MILLVALIILLALLILSIPVAAGIAVMGLALDYFFSPFPLYRSIGEITWSASTDFILLAIPLFVLLGEILLKAGIAERTYLALDRWLSWLPGGLLHANIGTSAMFSATSGSSVATAATITTVAMPQGRKLGYNESLFAGSIAAGGTLGILIPPSINLIIYGVLTNTSIPKLFLAGIVPGALLALMFMLCMLTACSIWPFLGSPQRNATWRQRFSSLKDLLPVVFIFVVVIGSIYAGFATPTESAALGVIAALVLAVAHGKLSMPFLVQVMEGTLRTTAMIMIIIIAANFLNFILSSVGLTEQLTSLLNTLGWGPMGTILVIILLYIILGFFIETLSLMVITIPIIAPIVVSLGFDPIWFGVLLILLIEMALITPPVGLNLYVVQGIRQKGSITEVMFGSLPFVAMIFLMIILLLIFPDLALILTPAVD
ncbi:MAG: TRAP transporter large permease [Desulfovermiculus sp.]